MGKMYIEKRKIKLIKLFFSMFYTVNVDGNQSRKYVAVHETIKPWKHWTWIIHSIQLYRSCVAGLMW